MHVHVPAALLVLIVAVPSARQAPSPPPAATFRTETNYVEVDAVATDAQGRIVSDLSQADFEILEDGRPQRIGAFSLVTLPVATARPTPPVQPTPATDVVTNRGTDGRIYLIVLDDLHTTVANTARVRAFLREFLERWFDANDLAAVAYTSGRLAASQDFTNDRVRLLRAVDAFAGRRLRSEAVEVAEALNRDPREANDTAVNPANRAGDGRDPFDPYAGLNPYEAERAARARSTLGVVRDLAGLMEHVRGRRKAMVLVSEGLTYNIYDGFKNAAAGTLLREATDAMGAAMRANVAIYSVDPRGLATSGDAIDVVGTSPNDPHFSTPGLVLDLLRTSQQSLRELSNQTGGFAGLNQNDLSGVVERLVRENSAYYLLGYYSTNDRRDGRFRAITVRVRRPNVQVRARRGYVASRSAGTDPRDAPLLVRANTSPIPITGIPMSLAAAPFAGTTRDASLLLTIEMGAGAFRFTERNDRFLDRVELAISAVDAEGTARGGRQHTLDLEMRSDNAALTRTHGLRVISELAVPPGRHRLRIAATEQGAGQIGTLFADVDVPDFRAPGIWMSGIAVTSADASETPTIRAQDPLAAVLVSPSTTARDFRRTDVIALLADVYDNTSIAPHLIELSVVVRAEDGGLVFSEREERSSEALQSRHRYATQIPLAGFAPGTYVVELAGRTRAGDRMSAARDVRIRVR